MKQRQGYTLIELLTVIGVAAVLVAVGLPSLQAMKQNSSLNGSAQELVSILRQAQGQAIAGQGNVDQQVHSLSLSNPARYEFVGGPTITLPTGITFPAAFDITFARRLGTTTANPGIDIAGASLTKHISVSSIGVITFQ